MRRTGLQQGLGCLIFGDGEMLDMKRLSELGPAAHAESFLCAQDAFEMNVPSDLKFWHPHRWKVVGKCTQTRSQTNTSRSERLEHDLRVSVEIHGSAVDMRYYIGLVHRDVGPEYLHRP